MAGEGDNDVPSDSALVTAAREGNGAALLALFARYRPALIAFLSGRVGDPGRVEELAQRTFDVAGDRLDTLREPERVGAWLHAIARRQVADDNARRRRRLSLDRPLPGGIPPPTAPAIPEQTAVGVEDLLAKLDATDRVIVRQYAEGYSVPEIAERLGVSRRIVARRLKAAQERLRILYDKD